MSTASVEKRDTIVLGASAGGIEALSRLLPAFTLGVEASVFVVQHLPADGHSVLDQILARATSYKAAFAEDGEVILPRRVYVAPPDRHLLIDDGRIRLWHGARENRSRPAIDPLFRSAAAARRGRVIAGVLSGLLDDGAAGLLSVKRCGGIAFVQSASDAVEPEMPERAAEVLGESLDGALSADAMGAQMVALVGTPAPAGHVPADVTLELEMLLGEVAAIEALSSRGAPVPVSCPECGGPLWSLRDGRLQRYRCHTGHTYGVEGLLSAQNLQIEQALWAAIKGLDQRSQVLLNLSRDESMRRRPAAAKNFETEAAQIRAHAQTLRDVLVASFREPRRDEVIRVGSLKAEGPTPLRSVTDPSAR
jgi:two-component system, chemotaxis family, protein-glutamate methylesterase/glutaminase